MKSIFVHYTFQTLKKNRSRTLVTVVGVMLSVALVTAVTVSIASARKYFERVAVEEMGDWCVDLYAVNGEEGGRILSDGRVSGAAWMRRIGYAWIGSSNAYKPYLMVGAVSEGFTERMPVVITEGRMPEKDTELLIPDHLAQNGGVELALGQVLTLDLGERVDSEKPLHQHDPYRREEETAEENDLETWAERLTTGGEQISYTVVGFYERPGFEDRMAPGYTALTVEAFPAASGAGEKDVSAGAWETGETCELWVQLKDLRTAGAFLQEQQAAGLEGETNQVLLRYSGIADSTTLSLLYGMAAILMGMVVVGSVALIYNAFSISITERTRQFGLMKSLGASRKQMMGSVICEGLILCALGIPLGIAVGCAGISVTIWKCQDLFAAVLEEFATGVDFQVHVANEALALAAALGLFTVLLSAWLPARKALRLSAMEAVKQNQEIRSLPKEVKTSRLTIRLFGLEGMLASRNFRRSRRRYRATVFSLFFSIVLFVCANSFCHYLRKGVEDSQAGDQYDLCFHMTGEEQKEREEALALYRKLGSLEGVDDCVMTDNHHMYIQAGQNDQTAEFLIYHNRFETGPWDEAQLRFVEDADFREYLEKNGLDADVYMDPDNPVAIVYDHIRYEWDGQRISCHMFQEKAKELELLLIEKREGYYPGDLDKNEGGEMVIYYSQDESREEPLQVPVEEAVRQVPVEIGTILEDAPWFSNGSGRIQIFLPASVREAWNMEMNYGQVYFMAKDYHLAYEKMKELLREYSGFVFNNAQETVRSRAILALLDVFTTGFLALISLISTANVWNTISTNVLLRRKEFAMLQAIGMTGRDLKKMLNYECLLYGAKSVLYAVPVSVALTWLIYERVKSEGHFVRFYIPWQTIAVVSAAVFLVVGSTMLYARGKLGKESLIEEMRRENL